jgi:hypothetical protein
MANPFGHSIMANPPPHVFDEDDDEDQDPPLSNISITIRAPVIIVGSNNVLSVDPAMTGSKVAVAIVTGLRQMSGISGGIPMIDEHGRPRPIIVDVDASTKIEGSDNIMGEKAVYTTVPPPAKAFPDHDGSKKRERDDNELAGDNSKRSKTG